MKLSALVLTKNEQDMIADCLKQLDFADEIIVLDQNSQDDTVKIAKKYTSQIFQKDLSFDKARNMLLDIAKGDWFLYVDADERLTPELIREIRSKIDDKQSFSTNKRSTKISAYFFQRQNIILGKFLKHGGWWPDYVPRLFKRGKLIKWQGRVHESPQIEGEFGYLESPVLHLTARSMGKMLEKSTTWAKIEAELNYEKGAAKVTSSKVVRAIISEFSSRYFIKFGFLDGFVGLVESVYQALHRAMVLTYLWELQNDTEDKFKKIANKYQ